MKSERKEPAGRRRCKTGCRGGRGGRAWASTFCQGGTTPSTEMDGNAMPSRPSNLAAMNVMPGCGRGVGGERGEGTSEQQGLKPAPRAPAAGARASVRLLSPLDAATSHTARHAPPWSPPRTSGPPPRGRPASACPWTGSPTASRCRTESRKRCRLNRKWPRARACVSMGEERVCGCDERGREATGASVGCQGAQGALGT